MDELDKLAMEAARSILAAETESPGSQELVNVEAAREILGKDNSVVGPASHPHPANDECALTGGVAPARIRGGRKT